MAKPLSFRCEALFTLDLFKGLAQGVGRGRKGRALLGAPGWIWEARAVLLGRGQTWPAGCTGRDRLPGVGIDVQVRGLEPTFRIQE